MVKLIQIFTTMKSFYPGILKDKVAEYISPPRSKVPTPLEIEVDSEKINNMETKMKTKPESPKFTEPVKVAELACMSSKELDDHLSGLRNNVKLLQEMECSFVLHTATWETACFEDVGSRLCSMEAGKVVDC